LTSRGGSGRAGTWAVVDREAMHSRSSTAMRVIALLHVGISVVVVVIGLVVIVTIVIGDLVAQFIFVVTLAGEVL